MAKIDHAQASLIVRSRLCKPNLLSLIGWTGMARAVRGHFLALREEDFVLAAELDLIGMI